MDINGQTIITLCNTPDTLIDVTDTTSGIWKLKQMMLDHLVPGMINDDNLLYGVECKFYNMTVESGYNCEALDYPGLYFAGDGAGYTHSLSQAAANGLYIAEDILNHF